MSPLLIIMGLPLLAALGLAAVPADRRSVFRWTTILATLGSAIAAVPLSLGPLRVSCAAAGHPRPPCLVARENVRWAWG